MRNYLFVPVIISLIVACSNPVDQSNSNAQNDSVKLINYDTTKFIFEPDIRLFTVMAFGNAAGYDNIYSYMFPERQELRDYLDSVLTNDFKEKIKGLHENIGINAFSLTYPPSFKWLPDSLCISAPQMPRKDSSYLQLLNEFYVEADIPKLWKKYEPILSDYNSVFIPFTNGISDIVNYCRLDSNYFGQTMFDLQICPFMQSESGFTCKSSSTIYIVVTPRVAGTEIFYHEPLHHIIHPIIRNFYTDIRKKQKAADIGIETRLKNGDFYLGIDALAEESLVRTIDYTLRGKYYGWTNEKTYKEINRHYAMGLTLIPFFYEELKNYETSDLTLEEYFPLMLQSYDFKKEQIRWKTFNDSIKHNEI